MEFLFLYKTYKSGGGHDYLNMISRLLDAEEFCAGEAVKLIDVQVNIKPYEHVVQMYDEKTNKSKENPEYSFQRRKKTLKMTYLSMVTSLEEEDKYFRSQPLDAEKFNEFCTEFRDYLNGAEQVFEEKDDFSLKALTDFVDQRFSVLPLNDATLNSMFDNYHEEKIGQVKEFEAQKKAGLIGDKVNIEYPKYWDTSSLDDSSDSGDSIIPTEEVTWSYGDEKYDDFKEFVKELTLYNWECSDRDGKIKDFEICKGNKVRVRFWGLPENAERCTDMELEIEGEGKSISFLEFMFLTNNHLFKYLNEIDTIFYEGYEVLDAVDGVPVIQIIQGS